MTGEITIIKDTRVKTAVSLTIEGFELPSGVIAYDQSGRELFISLRALDLPTLERLLADLRARVLQGAGYGHVLTILGQTNTPG